MAEDIELSFEDLTFQEDKSSNTPVHDLSKNKTTHNDQDQSVDQESEEEMPNVILVSLPYGLPLPVERILKSAEELCGEIKQHNYREKQSFAFIQFHDNQAVARALEKLNDLEIEAGQGKLQVETCLRITPGRDPRTHDFKSDYKNSTLVLKNLPFQLKQEKLEEMLNQYPWKPMSVSYLYDGSGMFRGMAFVKYKEIDHGTKVFEQMNGMDIQGRKLRIEYKRKVKEADTSTLGALLGTSLGNGSTDLTQGAASPAASALSPSAVGGSGGGGGNNNDSNNSSDPKLVEQISSFRTSNLTELAFPCQSSYQRRQIHQIAEKLGLGHYSTGEGETKYVLLKKKPQQQQQGDGTLSSPAKKEEKDTHHGGEGKGQPIKGRRRGDSNASAGAGSHKGSQGRSYEGGGGSLSGGGKWGVGSPDKDSSSSMSTSFGTPSKASTSAGGGKGSFSAGKDRWGHGNNNNNDHPSGSFGSSHSTSHSIAINRSPQQHGGVGSVGSSSGGGFLASSFGSRGSFSAGGENLLGSSPSNFGSSPTYRKSAAILHRPETPSAGLLRQPKGPDGTTGFSAEYRKARAQQLTNATTAASSPSISQMS